MSQLSDLVAPVSLILSFSLYCVFPGCSRTRRYLSDVNYVGITRRSRISQNCGRTVIAMPAKMRAENAAVTRSNLRDLPRESPTFRVKVFTLTLLCENNVPAFRNFTDARRKIYLESEKCILAYLIVRGRYKNVDSAAEEVRKIVGGPSRESNTRKKFAYGENRGAFSTLIVHRG